MKIEAAKTQETRYAGTLSAEQVREILTKAIRDAVNANYNGLRLDLRASDGAEALTGTVHFELVHDHLWFEKESQDRFAG